MINGISFFFSANLKESDHFRIINKDIISIISEDIIDHLISLISFNDLINIRVRYFLVQGLAQVDMYLSLIGLIRRAKQSSFL